MSRTPMGADAPTGVTAAAADIIVAYDASNNNKPYQVTIDDLKSTSGSGTFTTLSASSTATLSGATTISGATTLSNASIIMSALPTSDPSVAGQLWSNSGVLTVSAG